MNTTTHMTGTTLTFMYIPSTLVWWKTSVKKSASFNFPWPRHYLFNSGLGTYCTSVHEQWAFLEVVLFLVSPGRHIRSHSWKKKDCAQLATRLSTCHCFAFCLCECSQTSRGLYCYFDWFNYLHSEYDRNAFEPLDFQHFSINVFCSISSLCAAKTIGKTDTFITMDASLKTILGCSSIPFPNYKWSWPCKPLPLSLKGFTSD